MIGPMIPTELEHFGPRELLIASRLLSALAEDDRAGEIKTGSGLRIMFNCQSGLVFLTNDDFETWMIIDDKLERLFYCSECGDEFLESDMEEENMHAISTCGTDIIHLEEA